MAHFAKSRSKADFVTRLNSELVRKVGLLFRYKKFIHLWSFKYIFFLLLFNYTALESCALTDFKFTLFTSSQFDLSAREKLLLIPRVHHGSVELLLCGGHINLRIRVRSTSGGQAREALSSQILKFTKLSCRVNQP